MDGRRLTVPPMRLADDAAGQRRCGLMSHAATCPACLLHLSDERDRQLRARLSAWREGYRAGRAAGIEEGRAAEAGERDADWTAAAREAARRLPHAELDRRRYPPEGRPSWLRQAEDADD